MDHQINTLPAIWIRDEQSRRSEPRDITWTHENTLFSRQISSYAFNHSHTYTDHTPQVQEHGAPNHNISSHIYGFGINKVYMSETRDIMKISKN